MKVPSFLYLFVLSDVLVAMWVYLTKSLWFVSVLEILKC